MKNESKKFIATALKIPLIEAKKDFEETYGDSGNLPDIFDLLKYLKPIDDVNKDLEVTHIMFAFCSIIGSEFEEYAKLMQSELDRDVGKKWIKLKTSVKKRYTDNDARRKIESSAKYLKIKKKIAMYEKLHRQFIFGAAKSLELKSIALRAKLAEKRKIEGDFNVRETKKIRKAIKEKLN